MATHKPFRELVRPGSNFEFVGNTRRWATISLLLIAATIAVLFVNKSVRGDYLNWSIDFKGGTEMVFEFRDQSGDLTEVPPGDVRSALKSAGFGDFEVSEFAWTVPQEDGTEVTAHGMRIRAQAFAAVSEQEQEKLATAFEDEFAAKGAEVRPWSGNRMFVRSDQPIDEEAAKAFFDEYGFTMKSWTEEQREDFASAIAGTGEYRSQFAIFGLESQYAAALDNQLEGVDAQVVQVYGVGAKAGEKLRNDGIQALFYAIALIMLYLVFRFDVRYAPGAVAALLHDALLVVGVFAVTWTEVSLTTVAALLTVIGYSVNDTVVIFDRIRENVGRLEDKKFSRVINISLNETLSRTLLTSVTLLVVTLVMNIFGSGLVRNFAFAMNVGAVVGVYSSIFVASPVALAIHNRYFAGRPKRTS